MSISASSKYLHQQHLYDNSCAQYSALKTWPFSLMIFSAANFENKTRAGYPLRYPSLNRCKHNFNIVRH